MEWGRPGEGGGAADTSASDRAVPFYRRSSMETSQVMGTGFLLIMKVALGFERIYAMNQQRLCRTRFWMSFLVTRAVRG